MFVQVMQGKVGDRALLDKQTKAWADDVRPGAIGFLGSTAGVTDDGQAIVIARFESQDAARRNSERPEQAAWWDAVRHAFDGQVTFYDCPVVDEVMGGGSDDAGFVQVMHGRALDPETMRKAGVEMEDALHHMRPDILGGLVAWHGDRDFTQVIYFASEDSARSAETASSSSEEMDSWGKLLDGPITFLDLHNPQYL